MQIAFPEWQLVPEHQKLSRSSCRLGPWLFVHGFGRLRGLDSRQLKGHSNTVLPAMRGRKKVREKTHARSSSRELRIRVPFILQSILVGDSSPQKRQQGTTGGPSMNTELTKHEVEQTTNVATIAGLIEIHWSLITTTICFMLVAVGHLLM